LAVAVVVLELTVELLSTQQAAQAVLV